MVGMGFFRLCDGLLWVSTMAVVSFFKVYDGFVVGFNGGSVVGLLIMIFSS